MRLIRNRGVAVAQAARDLDLHEDLLRKWVREAKADPQSAFPGNGQMKPEQQEIEQLRRELARMKAERDILEKAAAHFARTRYKVRVHRKASRNLAGVMDLLGAPGFLAVSRAVAFMLGSCARRAPGRASTKSMNGRSVPASSPATEPMVRAASGSISWPKAFHAVCIVSNG